MISKGGAVGASWRADGRELWYGIQGTKLMAVEVTTNSAFQFGPPRLLFQVASGYSSGTDNGGRFLVATPTGQTTQTPFTVVLNWMAALQK